MRRSQFKHPLAILRTELGLGQKDMADKLGCSWRAIQSIELLDLKLSPKMANRICDETAVHFNWLMAGDPEAPIIDERGLPWSRNAYFDAQGQKLLPGTKPGRHCAIDLLTGTLARLCAALIAASQSKNIRSYAWRLMTGIEKAVDDLKGFPRLLEQFNSLSVDYADDTEAGRQAMLKATVKALRQWKEPRPKGQRKKKKG